MAVSLDVVALDKPDDVNVIVGQAHFIKTVEDLHEALAGVSSHLRFGIAFCEASAARLIRKSGNDAELTGLAVAAAQAISAGHAFVIRLSGGFPVNVLNPVKAVPEVCTIFCATANPVQIIIAITDRGRGVAGVIDGSPPVGVRAMPTWRAGTACCVRSATSCEFLPHAGRGANCSSLMTRATPDRPRGSASQPAPSSELATSTPRISTMLLLTCRSRSCAQLEVSYPRRHLVS